MAVNDSMVEKAIAAVARVAQETGGHGRVFVLDLEDAVNVWNGERGPRIL